MKPKTQGLPRKQHVVTACFLSRWSDTSHQIGDMRLERLSFRAVTPRRTGWEEWLFPEHLSVQAEAHWKEVEDQLPSAFATIDRGQSLTGTSLDALRGLVALHLARSYTSAEHWEVASGHGFDDTGIQELLNQPAMQEALFFEKTGLHPAPGGSGALAVGRAHGERKVGISLETTRFAEFARRLEQVRIWLSRFDFDLRTTSQPVVIGDSPVLLFNDTAQVSTPGLADTVFLPVGPSMLLEWPGNGSVRSMDDELVHLLNGAQARVARKRLFGCPSDEGYLRRLVVEATRPIK